MALSLLRLKEHCAKGTKGKVTNTFGHNPGAAGERDLFGPRFVFTIGQNRSERTISKAKKEL